MKQPQPTVDLGYPTPARGRIPSFRNVQEEAAFWYTHGFSDFKEELEPVEVSVSKNLSAPLSVRLDPVDRAEIERRARAKGVGPSTLIRMWVKEQLNDEAKAETPSR